METATATATATATIEEETKHGVVAFHKLFSFADSFDVILMVAGLAGATANGLSLPLMSVIFGDLIQSFGQTTDINHVVHVVSQVCLKFVYLGIGSAFATFLQVACWTCAGERQSSRIRNLYLKAILRQEIGFFDTETSTGEIIERMSGDTLLIQNAIGEKVGIFIQSLSAFVGGFTVAFSKGWLLALVLLSIIPPLMLAGGSMAIAIQKMTSHEQNAYSDAAIVVEQNITAIRTVASFTGERLSVSKYSKALKKAYKSSVRQGLVAGLGLGSSMCILYAGYSLGVWYGSKLILNKGYTGGQVVSVLLALIVGAMSLGRAAPCMNTFASGQVAAYKMFETINRKPQIDAYEMTGTKLDEIRGDIDFRDVHFSYPARPDEQVFRGLSLFIPSGTTVAVVGQSGSGKSTVISLIERFYDPQAGAVLIDGINLKELQIRWIRGKIGLVSQEPVLFDCSIRGNIAYGKDDATIEEIRVAAELANASKFIDQMPQGMDTIVGERATQLSGGQKQRIAIARAILKDPRILLLDEATSALDVESERIVQEALDRVMRNRTTVIVAHRLSTVRNADMIAVIQQGSIIEKGSHLELLQDPNGAYCQLIHLQEKNNRDSDQTRQSGMDKSEILRALSRKSSKNSLCQSFSQGSSGNNSPQALTVPFSLPVRLDFQESMRAIPDADLPDEKSKEVPLHRLAYLNKPELPVLVLGVIAAIMNGLVYPTFGLLIANVINSYYQPPPQLEKDSRFWSLIFFFLALFSLIVIPARSYFFGLAGSMLIRRIRQMIFEKVVNMEVEWFDDPANSSGAIGARLAADAATVRGLVGDPLGLLVESITTLVAALVIAFVANWQLSLIMLALIPMVAINGVVHMKLMKGVTTGAKAMYEDASHVATDAIGSVRTVASFSAEQRVMQLYKKKCEGPMIAGIKQGVIGGIGIGASNFLLFSVYAATFYAGARLVQDGKTTFGKVFRVFFALTMSSLGLSHANSIAPDSSKAKSAITSLFAILDRKSKIDPSDDSGMTLQELKGNIEFRHVSFKYPMRPDALIFHDLCLAIQSGKTVALVGESGSGKSTTIALLQRFYNPDSGDILIDGVEIKKLQLRWLRQQMGLVSQEPVLFNDTIRANIAYGKEDQATESEIVAAAELANAHSFISAMHQGYDTLVGERGIQLSGGQKQRIAIARAIVKNPKILLLDEATSALDAESERVVQEALDRVMVNRTTMIIAHRLLTIRDADLIAVVKNGVIVEKGRHEALIKINGGAYATLATLHSRAS